MKKVININFQGSVIPIEETAYDILKQYVESLRRYFVNEEGRDEIINDIEGRIAELFGETLKKGSTCITDEDVSAIIKSIGRPEDFDDAEEQVKSRVYEESGNKYTYTKGDRLYRNENEKVIAGVCGGIATYFGVDPLIIRILFIVCTVGFGFGLLVYLVLWVAVPSTASAIIGSSKKRLLRDGEDKLIAGVCKGLSLYFGVNVWIPRILFLIPFISIIFRWNNWGAVSYPNFFSVSFSPAATIVYIILWLVLPEAKSTSDRLEMKGEKVDLNSIKNNITEELKGVHERVAKFGAEAGTFVGERGAQVGKEFATVAKKSGRGLGDLIALLVKIFIYFIVAVILFGVVTGLFAVGVAMIGLMPLKNYLINDGTQTTLAWGALLLFIWVPVIGIVTYIIRRLAKMKRNSQAIRIGFMALWLVGLACAIAVIVSLVNDFRYRSTPIEQNITLANARVAKLELRADRLGEYYNRYDWFQFEPFARMDEDSVFINNVNVRLIKATADSFSVTLLKMSNGNTKQHANELSAKIDYRINQQDTVLQLSKGIAITPVEKVRNQMVYITVAVPVGKHILINRSVGGGNGHVHFSFGNNNNWDDDRNDGLSWDYDVEYLMTTDGLQRVDGKNEDNNNDHDDEDARLLDSIKQRREKEEERKQKLEEIEKLNKELGKDSVAAPAPPKAAQVPAKTASIETSNLRLPGIILSRITI